MSGLIAADMSGAGEACRSCAVQAPFGALVPGLTVLPMLQDDAERQATADWDFLCKPSTVQMLRQAMELLAAKAKGKVKAQAKL